MPRLLWYLLFLVSNSERVIVQGVRINPSQYYETSSSGNHHYYQAEKNGLQHEQQHANTIRRVASVDVPTLPEDHLVESLPFLQNGTFPTKHYAGHLPASKEEDGQKYFFYWLFEPDLSESDFDNIDDPTIPLVIWLNGGPGCSSMDGLFLENGPFRLVYHEHQWKMDIHKQSWHTSPAYVVYIDQPVGTGLSFTTNSNSYPKNDKEVNTDFYVFLVNFLTFHGDKFLQDNDDDKSRMVKRPLYFSGESHAGHYIPSMMSYILDRNDDETKKITIPLSGAAIGNGWVDPYHQYAGATAAYGYGLIDLAQKMYLDEEENKCQEQLDKQKYSASVCFTLLEKIVHESQGESSKFKVSQYDARKKEKKHGDRTFPPGHKDVESYLGGWPIKHSNSGAMGSDTTTQVLEAIHATAAATVAGQRYEECTDPPYEALAHQDGLGVVPDVVKILQHPSKIQMLFFNGIWDLICNHAGNEMMLQKLPWTHQDDWIKAPRYVWKAPSAATDDDKGDAVSGYVKEYENLLFLKVTDSGHMVPMDVPDVALDMMKIFMYGKSFDVSKQGIERSKEAEEKPLECPECPACPAPPDVKENAAAPPSTTSSSSGTSPSPEPDSSSSSSSHDKTQGDGQSSPVMGFVVAHSWIGAIFAVVVFLVILVVVRRRYGHHVDSVPLYHDDYDLELKQSTYRDHPLGNDENGNDDPYQDDDEEEGMETARANGGML